MNDARADIVEELRKVGFYASDGAASSDGTCQPNTFIADRTCLWAIDEIESLRGEVERLRIVAAALADSVAELLTEDGWGVRDRAQRALAAFTEHSDTA